MQMQTLARLNQEFRETYAVNTDIAGRVQSYELAARCKSRRPK